MDEEAHHGETGSVGESGGLASGGAPVEGTARGLLELDGIFFYRKFFKNIS
jgi:hypothetical protein